MNFLPSCYLNALTLFAKQTIGVFAFQLATFMSFSIIACVMSCVMIIPYSMTLAWSRFYNCNNSRRRCPQLAVAIILLIIPIVEFGIALASSIFCCMAASKICECCTGSGETVGCLDSLKP